MATESVIDVRKALAAAEERAEAERAARVEAERRLAERSAELDCVTTQLHAVAAELEAKLAELSRSREEVWRLANVDHATGLASRAWFERNFGPSLDLDIADGAQIALIFLDIDRLRDINDAFGANAGDRVISAMAERLGRATPPGWSLARIAGDRFAFASIRSAEDGCDLSAETDRLGAKIERLFERPIEIDYCEAKISVSIGGAAAPSDARSIGALRRHVDLALSAAKRAPETAYVRFERRLIEDVGARQSLAWALPRAIDTGLIEVWHQPKIALDTDAVVGVEALARWRREGGAITGPDAFVPIAEESALIRDLGRNVMLRALGDIGPWREEGLCPSVAVNVSPLQLRAPGFAEEVIDALETTGQPPEALQIEVTETAILADHVGAAAVLGRLKEIGVSVALDDFGSGVSNHRLLRELPVDTLKIDRSFVGQIGRSAFSNTVVDNILQLGRALGLTVVAEGVEEPIHKAFLQVRGCQIGQGFFWARPMPVETCDAYLRRSRRKARAALA